MLRFDRDTLQTLVSVQDFPCVSIYLPILREGNDVKMSQIRLRTLLRQAEDHLKGYGLTVPKIQNILQPASELLEQPLFWAVAPEALAMFMSENQSVIFSLEQPVDENMVIDDHFTVRPLLELNIQNAEYLLLAIGRGAVRVYRGSRNRLIQIPVSDLPESLETIVSAYSFEKQRRQYGGAAGSNHGAVAGAVNHGFENSKDRDGLMVEDYCRAVDSKILEHWQKENLPLVLASVDYLFAAFQKISKNPNLLPQNIPGSPDHLTETELRNRAWEIVQAHLPDQANEDWTNAQNFFGSEKIRQNIRQIIEAADHGRVDKLFIPRGKAIPGRFVPETREITRPQPGNPAKPFEHQDLLEFAAIRALSHGAQVHSIHPDQIPDGADAVALMRY